MRLCHVIGVISQVRLVRRPINSLDSATGDDFSSPDSIRDEMKSLINYDLGASEKWTWGVELTKEDLNGMDHGQIDHL